MILSNRLPNLSSQGLKPSFRYWVILSVVSHLSYWVLRPFSSPLR
ncbi:Uncharacterised protein [Vibrio cholerae]|nr:Uncharacterised protein [Vibrio cholerae]